MSILLLIRRCKVSTHSDGISMTLDKDYYKKKKRFRVCRYNDTIFMFYLSSIIYKGLPVTAFGNSIPNNAAMVGAISTISDLLKVLPGLMPFP